MQVNKLETVAIVLELTKKEASWLSGFIQNYPSEYGEESQESYNNREKLFCLLSKVL